MSELRSKQSYIVLAGIIVLVKVVGLLPMFDGHFSMGGKLLPVVIALSLVYL